MGIGCLRNDAGAGRLFEKLFVEINEVEFFGGPREGRIEPAEHVARHGLVAEEAAVDEDSLPLAALRLVAGDGVGKLHLNGIKVRIFTYFLEAFELASDLLVVLFHLVEKPLRLFARERRR